MTSSVNPVDQNKKKNHESHRNTFKFVWVGGVGGVGGGYTVAI